RTDARRPPTSPTGRSAWATGSPTCATPSSGSCWPPDPCAGSMAPMDLDTIRAFLAVADGHTVTSTAEQVHRTQPAVSRALARRGRDVGTPVFQRVGRTLALTPAGRELARHARDSIDAFERGVRSVQDITAPDAGFVPLAFLHTLGTWLVPELIREFRTQRPN